LEQGRLVELEKARALESLMGLVLELSEESLLLMSLWSPQSSEDIAV
jgi:hypothetical protein